MPQGHKQAAATDCLKLSKTRRADQSYWQSAVAATPAAAWKGYLLGALLWFSVPYTLSTGTPAASCPCILAATLKGFRSVGWGHSRASAAGG